MNLDEFGPLAPDNTGMVGTQFLIASGLLWKLNHDLLHPLGLSLAVAPMVTDPPPASYELTEHTGPVVLALVPAQDGVWTVEPSLEADRAAKWAEFQERADHLRAGLLMGFHTGKPRELT